MIVHTYLNEVVGGDRHFDALTVYLAGKTFDHIMVEVRRYYTDFSNVHEFMDDDGTPSDVSFWGIYHMPSTEIAQAVYEELAAMETLDLDDIAYAVFSNGGFDAAEAMGYEVH